MMGSDVLQLILLINVFVLGVVVDHSFLAKKIIKVRTHTIDNSR